MKKIGFLVLLIWVCAGGQAWAEEGYLVKVEKDTPMLMDNTLRPLYPEAGIYYTDDPEQAQQLGQSESAEVACQKARAELLDDFSFDLVYNDPYYEAGWLWHLDLIQARQAFSKNARGQGVKVGIIDTGLNPEHNDIDYAHIEHGYNVIAAAADPLDTVDYHGHGTFVAGMVCAGANNGRGIAGIADMVTLIPLKFIDPSQPEEEQGGYVSDMIAALAKADEAGCDIVNISAGIMESEMGEGERSILQSAVDYVTEKGMIVVAAAGNDSKTSYAAAEKEGFTGTDIRRFPAAIENVISVGCVQKQGKISVISNKNNTVDVVAGGEGVYGLGKNKGGSYLSGTGTSYASPSVAAGAAVIKSIYPQINTASFRELIKSTAKDCGTAGRDDAYGYGLLQLDDMIEMVLKMSKQALYIAPEVTENGKTAHYFKAVQSIEGNAYFALYHEGQMTNLMVFPLHAGMEKTVVTDADNQMKPFFWEGMRPVTQVEK